MPKPQLVQRLRREIQDIENNFADTLKLKVVDEEKMIWHVTFEGAANSVYSGEVYTLQFRFTE